MLIDLHMHEATFSPDSRLRLEEIVTLARQRGLDAICITDHDSMGLQETAEQYGQSIGFPVFVGVEYLSLEGDLIAFGIDHVPQIQIHAQAFIDYVHEKGGVCFSAHPFRNNNRGLGKHLRRVRGLDGIEAFNASTSFHANQQALQYCNQLGIQPLGVSDCHVHQKVGRFATRFPRPVSTLSALVAALREGGCIPVGYQNGRYRDLVSPKFPYLCPLSETEHDTISCGWSREIPSPQPRTAASTQPYAY